MGRLKSFTLIELIIVVGITSLMVPVVFSIVFVIIQQQTKIIRLQEVKRQGDFILSNIKTTIRNNAVEIYSNNDLTEEHKVCATSDSSYEGLSGQSLYFKDKLGKWFNYYLTDDKISSGSSLFISNPEELTNDQVAITNYTITCTRQSIYSTPMIALSITLQYNTTSTRPEDTAELTYNTNIKLKSY